MGFVSFDRAKDFVVRPAIDPAAARASSTNGTAVDTLISGVGAAKAVTFVFNTGVLTDGTYTLSVEESDSSGSGYVAVPAARTFNNPGTIAATADSSAYVIGAKVDKRYCRLVVTAAGTTTGGIYSASALLERF